MPRARKSLTSQLADLIRWCKEQRNPFNAFNDVILRRGPYWKAQREIAQALVDPAIDTIVVPAGHSVGKSYFAAGAVLAWLTLLVHSLVLTTSPSNAQLSLVLWKEIKKARNGSKVLRSMGRLTQLPHKLDLGDGWSALGYATNKPERMQGIHAAGKPFLVVVDEASGITDADIWATIASLKPSKVLLISNPLRAYGHFYETCKRAEKDKTVRLIRIPSTASPDIHLEESERGLADAKFLREMRSQYGEGSQTWQVRVEALFPDGSADVLIPSAWLDLCERIIRRDDGHRRMSVDLAGGNGGDNAVILIRDDAGIIHWEASNRQTPKQTAIRAVELARRYGVEPKRLIYDAKFKGADFAAQLASAGFVGCRPYYGDDPVPDKRYPNLRVASYFALRARLDPEKEVTGGHGSKILRPQTPFAIPSDFLKRLRPELRELTHEPGPGRQTLLRSKDEIKAALRHSPDFSDALAMSFSFNH